MSEVIHVFIDGASQGNPGPSGIGVAFLQNGSTTPLATIHKYIGETTNNVAEYTALVYALQEALIRGYRSLAVHTDSELLARQINGQYKVRDANLRLLHGVARHLIDGFASCQVVHIPREQNRLADRLAAQAIRAAPSRSA